MHLRTNDCESNFKTLAELDKANAQMGTWRFCTCGTQFRSKTSFACSNCSR